MTRLEAEESILDAMALARDICVESVGADSAAVKYRITFDIAVDRETWKAIGDEAKKRGQRLTSLIRCYARNGLRTCLAAEPAPNEETKSVYALSGQAARIAARHGE